MLALAIGWRSKLLAHLGTYAGFKAELRDCFAASVAAKVRVAHDTDLDLATLSTECFLARSAYIVNHGLFAKHSVWHMSSMASSLVLAKDGVTEEFEIGQSQFKDIILGTAKDKGLQRHLTKALGKAVAPSKKVLFTETLRKRLGRLRLGIPLGWAVTRGLNRMTTLSGQVKPAVTS